MEPLEIRIQSSSMRTATILVDWPELFALISIEDYYPLERGHWWRFELDCPDIKGVSGASVARDVHEAYVSIVEQVEKIDPVMAEEIAVRPASLVPAEPRTLRRRTTEK